MNNHDNFRDRLIGAQESTPEYRENYNRRLKQMLNRELTLSQRIFSGLQALVALAAVVVCVSTISSGMIDSQMAVVLTVVGLFALTAAVIAGRSAISGTINFRSGPRALGLAKWYISLAISIAVFLAVGQNPGKYNTVYIAFIGLIPLIVGAVTFVHVLINQSELTVREKLLEIELQLAEINSKLSEKQS